MLRVEASLIDLVVRVPTQSSGRERTYTTSTGEMTPLMEIRDSLSGEILVRRLDAVHDVVPTAELTGDAAEGE